MVGRPVVEDTVEYEDLLGPRIMDVDALPPAVRIHLEDVRRRAAVAPPQGTQADIGKKFANRPRHARARTRTKSLPSSCDQPASPWTPRPVSGLTPHDTFPPCIVWSPSYSPPIDIRARLRRRGIREGAPRAPHPLHVLRVRGQPRPRTHPRGLRHARARGPPGTGTRRHRRPARVVRPTTAPRVGDAPGPARRTRAGHANRRDLFRGRRARAHGAVGQRAADDGTQVLPGTWSRWTHGRHGPAGRSRTSARGGARRRGHEDLPPVHHDRLRNHHRPRHQAFEALAGDISRSRECSRRGRNAARRSRWCRSGRIRGRRWGPGRWSGRDDGDSRSA